MLPSSKYNVERSASIRGYEDQFTAMVLFHDATGERQSDPPAALLRGESRLENLRPQTGGNSRSIIRDPNPNGTVGHAGGRKANAATASSERIYRVLREYLYCPFEENGIALDPCRCAVVFDIDGDGVRECGNSRAKVHRDPIDERANVDRLAFWLPADALETMRHAVEALEVGPHVSRGRARGGIVGALLQKLDPASQTGERRA